MLLLWDFIYFPVPFAFQNRSQTVPIDYGSSLFYEARKPFIDEWLTQVSRLSDAQIQSRQAKENDLIRSVGAKQHRAASKRRFSDPMGQNRRWFAPLFRSFSFSRVARSTSVSFGGSTHRVHSRTCRSKRLAVYERPARLDVGSRSLQRGRDAQRAVCGSEGGERSIAARPVGLDPVFHGEIGQF